MSDRVLVVDDDERWRDRLKDTLSSNEFTVDLAETIKDATSLLKANSYQLVLLDILLDGEGNLSFYPFLTNILEKEYPNLPIIAISGQNLNLRYVFLLGKNHKNIVDFIVKQDLINAQLDYGDFINILKEKFPVKEQKPDVNPGNGTWRA